MKTERTVVLDCDDVLLEWSLGFKSYFEGCTTRRQSIDNTTTFSIGSQYGCSTEEGLRHVEIFNTSPAFQRLAPTPGAIDAVDWLLEDGYKIIVITACGVEPNTQTMRRRNLENVFGVGTFNKVIFVPGGHSKVEFLKDYPKCFFVDDSLANLESARMQTETIPVFMKNYMNQHLAWDGPSINNLVSFYNSFIAEPVRA